MSDDNPRSMPAARSGSGRAPARIQDLLERADTRARLAAAIPRHLSADRMLRVASMAIWRTPKLQECHPMTLLGAILTCASLGLEPNTPLGHAYLLPFVNRKRGTVDVNLIIGYRGYLDLARRSGALVSVHADVVKQADEFDYCYGTQAFLRHRPAFGRDRGQTIGSYCHLRVKDGEGFRVLSLSDIEAARARSMSGSSGPWMTDFDPMAAKTAIRRLVPYMPMSLELASAAAIDERPVDYRAVAEADGGETLLDAAALAGHDDDEPQAPPVSQPDAPPVPTPRRGRPPLPRDEAGRPIRAPAQPAPAPDPEPAPDASPEPGEADAQAGLWE